MMFTVIAPVNVDLIFQVFNSVAFLDRNDKRFTSYRLYFIFLSDLHAMPIDVCRAQHNLGALAN